MDPQSEGEAGDVAQTQAKWGFMPWPAQCWACLQQNTTLPGHQWQVLRTVVLQVSR